MISSATIQEAVDRLAQAAHPKKIFLFGSYARGEAGGQSDLDFLVIEETVKQRHRQMVYLQDILRPMRLPVDILVASEATFNEWADVTGTIFNEIKREGILCYDASQVSPAIAVQG
jgi:uncharacterized protein